MEKIKKAFWFVLGIILLGVAYIGIVTPGIPWSTPTVCAAFCFSKSSERMHKWIMNHKLFGPFLRNWSEKRVFPTRGKWAMVLTMDFSLVIIWFTTHNVWYTSAIGMVMLLVAIWAWRFPGSVEEWQRRVNNKLKIGWFK
jgi:uncharacterized protein